MVRPSAVSSGGEWLPLVSMLLLTMVSESVSPRMTEMESASSYFPLTMKVCLKCAMQKIIPEFIVYVSILKNIHRLKKTVSVAKILGEI